MKTKSLSLTVFAGATVLAAWLGVSFATTPEVSQEEAQMMVFAVNSDHPDSHRRGELVTEEVPLPEWNSEVAGAGLLALAE